MPRDLWHCIGIHDVALGSMYSYLIISTDIGIYVIFLGIHVLHWDTCHCIGICDSASSHDRDAMSSHLPHGPLRFVLLAQLDIVLTLVHYYSLLDHTWEIFMHLRRQLQVVGVVKSQDERDAIWSCESSQGKGRSLVSLRQKSRCKSNAKVRGNVQPLWA
jgi:hypothetical protein